MLDLSNISFYIPELKGYFIILALLFYLIKLGKIQIKLTKVSETNKIQAYGREHFNPLQFTLS